MVAWRTLALERIELGKDQLHSGRDGIIRHPRECGVKGGRRGRLSSSNHCLYWVSPSGEWSWAKVVVEGVELMPLVTGDK